MFARSKFNLNLIAHRQRLYCNVAPDVYQLKMKKMRALTATADEVRLEKLNSIFFYIYLYLVEMN